MEKAKEVFESMQTDFDIDNFFLHDLLSYVRAEPLKDSDTSGDEAESYGKNNEQIARDALILLKFMLSTKNYRIKRDISECYDDFPKFFEKDEDLDYFEKYFFRMLDVGKDFLFLSYIYEIERIDPTVGIPEHIPDEVAAIFKKVTD